MPLPVNYDGFRPKVCAFFAGRVWYAGIPSPEKSSWVLFSQVLTDISNVEKCYQQNDPTSEAASDVLASDGGLIPIPEAGDITGLVALGNALLVFASNGVWQIVGGQDGFSATAYSVNKVTDAGCIFQKTIIKVEDAIFYWSYHGIFVLSAGQTGDAQSVNITDLKIKTLYNSIPNVNKSYVNGAYNNNNKIVHWLYSDDSDLINGVGKYVKNRVLAYDIRLQSFYTYTIDQSVGPLVVAASTTKDIVEAIVPSDIYVLADQVLVGIDEVQINTLTNSSIEKKFMYLTLDPLQDIAYPDQVGFGFSNYNHTYFNDWLQYDDVGAIVPAYLVTGYSLGNVGPARAKTANYIHMFMKKTETFIDALGEPDYPSSILMTTRWDFTDNSFPGKWSDQYEVYRQPRPYFINFPAAQDDGYPLVISKNKIRGRGKALQIKFESNEDKDMHIYGWSIGFTNNTNV